jgi:hypothetical protein
MTLSLRKIRLLSQSGLVVLGLLATTAHAQNDQASSHHSKQLEEYRSEKTAIRRFQQKQINQWRREGLQAKERKALALEITNSVTRLALHWIGSDWGRGVPQSNEPHTGKTNCGTFVGAILRDAGFNLDIKKLQLLPSQAIIGTFVKGKRVKKFIGVEMPTFLEGVREMGPGLYIIGLDQHVGLLVQDDKELRYFHSSIETGKVASELAAEAWTIQASRYRIVGKILSPQNLRDWLGKKPIAVPGKKKKS